VIHFKYSPKGDDPVNLGNQYFGGPTDLGFTPGQGGPDVMATKHRAVLYVFKPFERQFGDIGLRPFQYRFDENFTSSAQEVTDMSKRGIANSSAVVNNLMDTLNLSDYMLPSQDARMLMRTSQLSNSYRFILVLTEDGTNMMIGGNTFLNTNSASQVRRIYTGFFQDEPFNFQTYSSSTQSLNPNAHMVITHKTIVNAGITHGRLGASHRLNTQSSEEIIQSQIANTLMGHNQGRRDTSFYLMTPASCVNSVEQTEDGHVMFVPGASDLSRDQGSNFISEILEQPHQNVGHLIKGLMNYQDEVSHRSRLNTNRVDQYYEDEFMDQSMGRSKLSRHLDIARSKPVSALDLDVDSRISAVDLDGLVGHQLQVVPMHMERPLFYDTADQMENSITNQYQFLITSVVSPLLNSAGLTSMSFRYQVAKRNGQVLEDFVTQSAAPAYVIPTEAVVSMAKAVEVELRRSIFKTIFEAVGDFHVLVKADTTGMTTVCLSLEGQGYHNEVPFEIPTCMGGLASPLIGDAMTNACNSEAIESLVNASTGTSSKIMEFNEKDKQFLDFANSGDWQNAGQLRMGDVGDMQID
jgi:hypothetical protein